MRKLLVVVFHYPPDNSSTGVLRTLKFTQYLGRRGWGTEVISVPTGLYLARDAKLAEQIPSHTRVTRVCKTRNEWNNTHANTRDNMNDMQRNASGGSSCRQDQMGGC